MSDSLQVIRDLINECSEEDRRALRAYLRKLMPHPLEQEWGIDADTILNAIERSSDLTKRGMRGIIAEAIFVKEVVPTVAGSGWFATDFNGDRPYDSLLAKGGLVARIQVKLQRLEKAVPKLYHQKFYEEGSLYVVEVQKTRTGERTAKKTLPGTEAAILTTESISVNTRPYSFGDFDILAVNMHPSSRNWRSFRYTVASWLLPRPTDTRLIEVLQPVSATPNDVWTDDLSVCLAWFESGQQLRVLSQLLHLRAPNRTTKRNGRGRAGSRNP